MVSRPLYQDLLQATIFSDCHYFCRDYEQLSRHSEPSLLMGFVALIFSIDTTNTKFGRYSYALGGNLEATRLSGINTKATVFKFFLAHGINDRRLWHCADRLRGGRNGRRRPEL